MEPVLEDGDLLLRQSEHGEHTNLPDQVCQQDTSRALRFAGGRGRRESSKLTSVKRCPQLPGVFRRVKPSYSLRRISASLPLIVSRSCCHRARRAGSPRMEATSLAPNPGVEVISAREILFSCPSTRAAASRVLATTCSTPTRSPYRPKFLEKDWATASSRLG